MYDNASCRIVEPESDVDSDDSLQRTHRDTMHDEQRCSLRALSASASITALGKVSVRGWTCRLVSDLGIRPGWRIDIQRDDEDEWHEYVVRQTQHTHHWKLTLEGME